MLRIGRKNNTGFTLVETMVAIAVFSIVMTTAMSALLNVIDANNKARSIKTAVNNISFALEGISKDMRMGTDYACGTEATIEDGDCIDGGKIIRYKKYNSQPGTTADTYVFYRFFAANETNIPKGYIASCSSINKTGCGADAYSRLTSSDVDLTAVSFYVLGVTGKNNPKGFSRTQPRMIMTVSGEAGSKDKTKTKFDLQTGVSQVSREVNI